ncbi:alpha/beta hydrolase [Niveibacterium terrae]|uniref:alpha/beta hydrolase n=1 Tax=Niveibacterium terrae TaxID=3373598 RepID=UPI003A954886
MKRKFLLLAATLLINAFGLSAVAAEAQPPEAFTFLPDQSYAEGDGGPFHFDFYQEARPQTKQPVIIWLPREGRAAKSAPVPAYQGRFPTPIASYLGYHYSIVSIDGVPPQGREARLRQLIDFLDKNAERYRIDTANIGVIQPTVKGYEARILRQSAPGRTPALPVPTPRDWDYLGLQEGFTTRLIVSYFAMHLHGGAFDAHFDPLALRDPDTAWVDPITQTAPGTRYHRYATPSRGPGSFGSYMLYLPKSYASSGKRYPVIYYLHGGNGNQREGRFLVKAMEAAMQRGEMPESIVVFVQALPIGWYVNANDKAPGVESGPVEEVLIRDLIPHIDASYRTIAGPVGRGLEGWSMGGFGAMRLAFKYPDTFGAASSLGGALIDWSDEKNVAYLTNTFGPADAAGRAASIAFFDAQKPSTWAIRNADAIAARSTLRVLVGEQDWLSNDHGRNITREFSLMLSSLGLEHEYRVLPGVGHMIPEAIGQGRLAYPAAFWKEAFRYSE